MEVDGIGLLLALLAWLLSTKTAKRNELAGFFPQTASGRALDNEGLLLPELTLGRHPPQHLHVLYLLDPHLVQ